jgi:disulfide bond formation protein DsbB
MMSHASLPAERILLLAGSASLALIAGALGFQYLGHILPCEMCHWQRWPHIAAAVLGIGGALLARGNARILAWIVVALIVASGLIGAYQTGMQIGLLPGPQACSVAHPYVMGSNEVPDVQCNVVTWSLFGLSLAAYNAIFSFLIAATAALLLLRRT